MGPKALATTRGLYDAPERRVREAALKAGAWLDDPLVLPHLEVFAQSEDPESRRLSAVLMAELPWDPRLEFALTKLVDDSELDIRLAAYEALVDLGSSTVRRVRFHPEFEVDLVDSNNPLIYVTQTLIPRVVVFAPQHELARPLFADLTTQNMMAVAEDGDDLVRLRYDGKVIGSAPHFWLWSNHLPPPRTVLWDAKDLGWTMPRRLERCMASAATSIEVFLSARNKTGCWQLWPDDLKCVQTKLEASDKILMRTSPSQSKILVKGVPILSRFPKSWHHPYHPPLNPTRSRT